MRRVQKGKGKKPRKKTEPLAEGIIPLDKRGRRNWASMNDEELLNYAHGFAKDKRLETRTELAGADRALYDVLRARELLGKVIPASAHDKRPSGLFPKMSDKEVMDHARDVIKEKGVKGRGQLAKTACQLYEVLRKRKLLDRVFPETAGKRRPQGFFPGMGDEELVDYARGVVGELGVKGSEELSRADSGLCYVLRKRKLLGMIFPDICKRRPWGIFTKMSDDELVSLAQKVIEENGVERRSQLTQADSGLHGVLASRKLLDRLFPEIPRRPPRFFTDMSDDEIVDYAKRLVEEEGIPSRKQLGETDSGLYNALLQRKLVDALGLENKKGNCMDWKGMGDEEKILIAQTFIEENSIRNISQLQSHGKTGKKLYEMLRIYGLLDRLVLKEKKKPQRKWIDKTDSDVLDMARRFIANNRIKNIRALGRSDPGMYAVLRQRSLLSELDFEKPGKQKSDWKSMDNPKLIGAAEELMGSHGLETRTELMRKFSGLYKALSDRGLLDRLKFREPQREKRDWASMSDDDIVRYAQKSIDENGIENRIGLANSDPSLYGVLRKRKLLDAVFLPIEQAAESQKKIEAVQQVVDAMKEFDA